MLNEWKWLMGPFPRPRSKLVWMPASTYRTAISTASGISVARSGDLERAMPEAIAAAVGVSPSFATKTEGRGGVRFDCAMQTAESVRIWPGWGSRPCHCGR